MTKELKSIIQSSTLILILCVLTAFFKHGSLYLPLRSQDFLIIWYGIFGAVLYSVIQRYNLLKSVFTFIILNILLAYPLRIFVNFDIVIYLLSYFGAIITSKFLSKRFPSFSYIISPLNLAILFGIAQLSSNIITIIYHLGISTTYWSRFIFLDIKHVVLVGFLIEFGYGMHNKIIAKSDFNKN